MDGTKFNRAGEQSTCRSFPVGEFLGAMVGDLVGFVRIAIDRNTPETARVVDEYQRDARPTCVSAPMSRALELKLPANES